MLTIWHGDDHWESPQKVNSLAEHKAWLDDLEARGIYLGGGRLKPAATTKVQVRNG